MIDKNTFCRLPWEGLSITTQDGYRPCCHIKPEISFDSYKNSKTIAIIKQEFSEGKKPKACSSCWNDESAGILSIRQTSSRVIENTTFDETIKLLSLSFGNTCNLACMTCNSYSSSKWGAESSAVKSEFPELKIFPHNKFYQDEDFLDRIVELGRNAVYIEFMGGEPFLTGQKEHLYVLSELAKHNPKQKRLHYITNTTVWPSNQYWDIWNQFGGIDIHLSIDGFGKIFEYMRWPADWNLCYNNIVEYKKKAKELENVNVYVSYTVSALNVYHSPETLDWFEQMDLQCFNPLIVDNPSKLDIRNLPLDVKDKIAEKLQKNAKCANIVDVLYQEGKTSDMSELLKHIRVHGQRRNQVFSDYFSEYAKILKL